MNEGEAAVKHAKRRRLSQRTLPPLHTNTTECVNTRTLALNLHNKIPLFKNSAALKRSLEYRISQTKKNNKKINKTKKKRSGYSQERQKEQDAKNTTKHRTSNQTSHPPAQIPQHDFPFGWKTSTQTKTQTHKKPKVLHFGASCFWYRVSLVIKFSDWADLIFFFPPLEFSWGKISLQLYTKVRVNEHNTCDPLTPRMPKKKKVCPKSQLLTSHSLLFLPS